MIFCKEKFFWVIIALFAYFKCKCEKNCTFLNILQKVKSYFFANIYLWNQTFWNLTFCGCTVSLPTASSVDVTWCIPPHRQQSGRCRVYPYPPPIMWTSLQGVSLSNISISDVHVCIPFLLPSVFSVQECQTRRSGTGVKNSADAGTRSVPEKGGPARCATPECRCRRQRPEFRCPAIELPN